MKTQIPEIIAMGWPGVKTPVWDSLSDLSRSSANQGHGTSWWDHCFWEAVCTKPLYVLPCATEPGREAVCRETSIWVWRNTGRLVPWLHPLPMVWLWVGHRTDLSLSSLIFMFWFSNNPLQKLFIVWSVCVCVRMWVCWPRASSQ